MSRKVLCISRILFTLGLVLGFGFGDAFKLPFRVKDLLPVLPRQISWPVLNNIHSAVDLLPSYIGSLAPHNGSIDWKGACFLDNSARVELTAAGDRGIGGAVIYLSVCFFLLLYNFGMDVFVSEFLVFRIFPKYKDA